MHGVKRARQSEEVLATRRQKERSKLEEYLRLSEDILDKKKARDYSDDAFVLTTRLLNINPELYTVWNYRRDILLNGTFQRCTKQDMNDILSTDLMLTMSYLKQHPKVYWIWNHRRWCLENVPEGPGGDAHEWKKQHWTLELRMVEKLLDADARNFHAWDYRRYVLASMPVKRPELDELAYTTRKIEANFSNFSAWHQRSKIYASLWEQGVSDEARDKISEFFLVKQALYVDPFDQSAWIYHRWLIGTGNDKETLLREIEVIEELTELEPDCKWCHESLVHYRLLLLEKHIEKHDGPDERRALTVSLCVSTLERLEQIDPPRKRRYQELAKTLL